MAQLNAEALAGIAQLQDVYGRENFALSYGEDAVFPDTMAGRTLISTTAQGQFTFEFDADGGGSWELAGVGDGPLAFYSEQPDGFGSRLLLAMAGLSHPWMRVRLGDDVTEPDLLLGGWQGSWFGGRRHRGQHRRRRQ